MIVFLEASFLIRGVDVGRFARVLMWVCVKVGRVSTLFIYGGGRVCAFCISDVEVYLFVFTGVDDGGVFRSAVRSLSFGGGGACPCLRFEVAMVLSVARHADIVHLSIS